ncbi:hypothetical protein FGIG_10417 [Fasciola gigantica]|uniref:Uncharacterized protein n=1 Tax=Fasciola gigantica TaxID=46835 RepID=A0A504Z011_FASGI|nr:hypothetical protein FGIG_10417 [Fasciola gigantica]
MFKFGPLIPSSSPFAASASVPSSTPSNGTADEENEEYHPPKPEVREIKEEGSVYTIRYLLVFYCRSAFHFTQLDRPLIEVWVQRLSSLRGT